MVQQVPIKKVKLWPVVINIGQPLVKGQGQSLLIKVRDKEEFRQFIISLQASILNSKGLICC